MAKVKRRKKKRRSQTPRLIIGLGLIVLVVAGLTIAFILLGGGGRGNGGGTHGGSRHVAATDESTGSVVVYSGDIQGRITPYQCEEGELGGVARMATLIAKWTDARKDRILVDTGNSTFSRRKVSPQVRASVNEFAFSALDKLGYDVVNCGDNEASLSLEDLRKLAKDRKFHLISANLVRVDTGGSLFPGYHILRRGGKEVAIIGVMRSEILPRRPGLGLRLIDPAPALRAAVSTLKKRADLIIVLAYLPTEEIYELARRNPEVHVIIGGLTPVTSAPFEMAGRRTDPRTIVTYLGDQGTTMGRLQVTFRENEPPVASGTVVVLNDDIESDPAFVALASEFSVALSGTAPPGSDQDPRMPCTSSYVGADVCKLCHIKQFYSWQKTAHAGAYVTLLQKGENKNPACLVCHATGYAMPSGYDPNRLSAAAEEADLSLLRPDHILAWPAFCTRLATEGAAGKPGICARLWDGLHRTARKTVQDVAAAKAATDDQRSEIVKAINALLQQPKLCSDKDIAALELGEEAKALAVISRDSISDQKALRLNRLLLEAAFPNEVAESKPSLLSRPKGPSNQDPLKSVGCECCHGGSRHHLGLALKNRFAAAKTPLLRPPASLYDCRRCHISTRPCREPDAAEPYDRNEYIEKIKHWK